MIFVFLRYKIEKKEYKVLDLETRKIMDFRDMMFNENTFLFSNKKCEGEKSPYGVSKETIIVEEYDDEETKIIFLTMKTA